MTLLLLLAACAETPDSPAPADWFYADNGGAIDWSSVRFAGADVLFDTVGRGLVSGPVSGAAQLACGAPTRATLAFAAGRLVDVVTVPAAACVEAAAEALDWASLPLAGRPLGDTPRALVVYDVPAEATCSSCS